MLMLLTVFHNLLVLPIDFIVSINGFKVLFIMPGGQLAAAVLIFEVDIRLAYDDLPRRLNV